MILKKDPLNAFKLEAVTIKEAVTEAVEVEAIGYEGPHNKAYIQVQKQTKILGALIETLCRAEALTEADILKILDCYMLTSG